MSDHQSKADSFMEALTNTAIGFIISIMTWWAVAWYMGLSVSWLQDLQITSLFTLVSIIRSYLLRRAFNGRSVWSAIRSRI